jgi:hypothetical protein
MSTKAIFLTGFFDELKRRKVYRVAVAYAIAAGGVIQLASAVFPAWELPNWTLRLTVLLLLVGFPIALILAWAYDVTPSGIRMTPNLALATGGVSSHAHPPAECFSARPFRPDSGRGRRIFSHAATHRAQRGEIHRGSPV